MTDHPYSAPCSYFLIYVYELPGSVDHAGLLKVGDTSFKSPKKPSELTVNCAELKDAAKKRIDQQTGTAGMKYVLHHAELAVRMTQDGGVKMITPFRDHDVHDVLEKSGYKHVKIADTKGREWYKADLETIKNAIAAVKEGRIALDSSELKKPDPFKFREEQVKAIDDTLTRFKKHNDMLWDAKMRFGKTPTALEVVRRGGFRKTIIITHRPVVGSSWEEDYHKIFPNNKVPYSYVDKTKVVAKGYEAKEEADKKDILKKYDKAGKHFIYFASIQDLRGSKRVGGDFFKNDAVFDTAWDLVIVDEAHEGTQTELGKKVSDELIKSNKKTKVLSLSGTPFNLLPSFDDGAVFEWDYVKEQTAKTTWDEKHPNEPNPYAVLPRMNIYTFDLSADLSGYAEEELEGKAFNFTEFFRTWTGDRDADGRAMPKGVKVGDFIHAEDVRRFLDLLAKPSATSRYPFATAEYCDYFRHSLWMVPGVAAAKALSEIIHNHPLYKTFGVANVAGQGDDYEEEHEDNALELVRSTIRKYPRSITLSCGKLTTGVTVPEWTAVLMIAGSVHTAASSYMQTIFRVQSPWVEGGKVKEECYVFDFAPDRALTVIAETAQLSKRISKDKDKEAEGRRALGEFLNFCPVIALEGGKARQLEVNEMMRRLKHVFVMRAIRNGFDDPSIYDNAKLMTLGKLDLKKFNDLEAIVGKTKQTEATNEVTINDLGFDQAEFEKKKKEKEKKLKRKLTPEEEEALRKRREELKMRRDAISILRAISIRMPMLIYGADVPVDEKITIERFVKMVDEKSWEEFMPKGVTKKRFADFIEYYDRDVFEDAGIQIRKLAKSAEKLPPGQRVQQIARIFSYFKNPDKETVLTPWRVVNMHMSDTLGGWCFFDEEFDAAKPLDEPRFVDRGDVTDRVFKPSSKILEINSKSGLYPLYVAYSIYRRKCGEIPEQDIAAPTREKKWRETVKDNVFVICKTPMAASITRRTLVGYSTAAVNAIYVDNLIDTLKSAPDKFIKKITRGNFWKREEEEMKFDAVVGNPPYQIEIAKKKSETNGQARRKSIFQYFQLAADDIATGYASLIYPGSRWIHRSGKGMEKFGLSQINDPRLCRVDFYPDSQEVFTSVAIADGISIVCKDMQKTTSGFEYVYHKEGTATSYHLENPGDELIPLNPRDGAILEKVKAFCDKNNFPCVSEKILSQKFFGVESDFVEKNPKLVRPYKRGMVFDFAKEVKLFTNDKAGKAGRAQWYVAKRNVIEDNKEFIDQWKVVVSSANAGGQKRDWQIEVFDNHSAFGRARVGLGSFKTKAEAENFYAYCTTYLIRFLFLMTEESLTSLAKKVPDVLDYTKSNKLLDFTKDLNAQLYALCGLTSVEVKYIEKTIIDMDASRSRRKTHER